jgi:transcriptional regulator with XRE-family HTH domain
LGCALAGQGAIVPGGALPPEGAAAPEVIHRDDLPWARSIAEGEGAVFQAMSDACSNVPMPYDLREQPVPIEDVILHFGADLRNVRLMRLETQTRLREACGVSHGTWSMIENGLAEGVRLELIARIAAMLELDLVFRPCNHPPGTGRRPPNGRTRRTAGARRLPGSRRLEPGPDWDVRTPFQRSQRPAADRTRYLFPTANRLVGADCPSCCSIASGTWIFPKGDRRTD